MKTPAVCASLWACIFIAASACAAQNQNSTDTSESYSQVISYDVPYVPTPQEVVDEMLKIAQVGPKDSLIDLGSGDGRIVLTAVQKHGARGLGVDLNPEHIKNSRKKAAQAGVSDRAKFVNADLFETEIKDATVISMYLLPSVNLRLRPRLLTELKPGTRIVSHDFDMDDWKPDQKITTSDGSEIYYWVIPARVGGSWTLNVPYSKQPLRLQLQQQFQEIGGSVTMNNQDQPLRNAKLEGDTISFAMTAASSQGRPQRLSFKGTVNGNSMNGMLKMPGQKSQKWSAQRSGPAATRTASKP